MPSEDGLRFFQNLKIILWSLWLGIKPENIASFTWGILILWGIQMARKKLCEKNENVTVVFKSPIRRIDDKSLVHKSYIDQKQRTVSMIPLVFVFPP